MPEKGLILVPTGGNVVSIAAQSRLSDVHATFYTLATN